MHGRKNIKSKNSVCFPKKLFWLVVVLQTMRPFSSEDWNFNIWLQIFKIGHDQFLRKHIYLNLHLTIQNNEF